MNEAFRDEQLKKDFAIEMAKKRQEFFGKTSPNPNPQQKPKKNSIKAENPELLFMDKFKDDTIPFNVNMLNLQFIYRLL